MKSDGDFEDILAADKPDVWTSNRPAKGGEAGAMLATIIARAAKLKAGAAPAGSRKKEEGRSTKAKGAKKATAAKKKTVARPAARRTLKKK